MSGKALRTHILALEGIYMTEHRIKGNQKEADRKLYTEMVDMNPESYHVELHRLTKCFCAPEFGNKDLDANGCLVWSKLKIKVNASA